MSWAFVENNIFQEHGQLPDSWRNVSNLIALESQPQELAKLGWYLIVDQSPVLTDDLLQYHSEPEYYLDPANNCVIKTCLILSKPNVSPESIFQERRKAFLTDLRTRRDELLKLSDWTQAVDIQNLKSDQFKSAWQDYRQALRDLPQVYSTTPNDLVVDSNQVEWPPLPNED